jgi:hypothetical protein
MWDFAKIRYRGHVRQCLAQRLRQPARQRPVASPNEYVVAEPCALMPVKREAHRDVRDELGEHWTFGRIVQN